MIGHAFSDFHLDSVETKSMKMNATVESMIYARTSFDFCIKSDKKYEATLIRKNYPLKLMLLTTDGTQLIINYNFGWEIQLNNSIVARCTTCEDVITLLMPFMDNQIQFSLLGDVELNLCNWSTMKGFWSFISTLLHGGALDLLNDLFLIYSKTLCVKTLDIKIDHDFVIHKVNDIWILLFEEIIGVSSYDLDFLISLLHPTGIFLTEIYCFSNNSMSSFYLLNQTATFIEYCQRNGEYGIFGSFQQLSKCSLLDMDYVKQQLL